MSKKIQLLNDALNSSTPHPVLFLFPPIALPIDNSGYVVPEDSSESVHYTTVVFSVKDKVFYMFEFGKSIFEGILAYKARHKKMSRLEVLLSREGSGEIRMTTGMTQKANRTVPTKEEYHKVCNLYDVLYKKYLKKEAYKVSS